MAGLSARFKARKAGQAANVTLTSAASVGVPTKAEFDKVVADIAALRTALRNAGLMA